VSSTKEQEQLLTLQYLESKLRQAEADVGMFGAMISEIKELSKDNKQLGTANTFLKIVSNSEEK
jgi:hypothetical protein